jgi:putative redox protein
MIDQFDRLITLEGPLSADQRSRLMAIAEKCPVHRTLINDKRIVTDLAETTGDSGRID